ncbi:MAG: phenylalanine--tRNA ligase subunit beta [Candidatus Nomurabacteria bacterium]|nr:phenylalanine--tRNA ligase subunit beta [Candidatus Nomurabacteria bacterium]
MKISYNWLKWYIPEIPEADKIADILTYHLTEVDGVEKLPNGDTIFDVNILPNRAPDLLSHSGMARELAGQLGLNFNDPDRVYKIPEPKPTNLKITLDTDRCNRYMGRIVRGIKIGPSPEWVVTHLESIGQRSINNIVDATNLVMYNCGNPTHSFDLSKFANETIVVRNAIEGEELKLVGREGTIAKLKSNDLVITDGEKTLALAGVKGGFDSGVSDSTADILLEVASFDAATVRKTARRLGILTDSAKRFENNLSASTCPFAMKELSALISEMFPEAVFEDIVDVYPNPEIQKTLKFTTEYISKMLGLEISNQQIEKFMNDYSFGYANDFEKGEWTVTIPLARRDLVTMNDMAEEIGRVIGYDKVIPTIPKLSFVSKVNDVYENILKAKEILLRDGYREVMTYGFTNKGDIEVLASASDKNFLRKNLIDGLKESFNLNKLNAPFLGLNEVKIFEIGTVFSGDKEEIHVCFANKKEVKETSLNEFIYTIATSEVLSKKSSDLLAGEKGELGQTIFESTSDSASILFKSWSTFPFMTRDISVWVPENVESDELKNIYKEFGTELLVREPQLVDKFVKPSDVPGEVGKISYAYRLVFQSYEKTLTDDEINQIMGNISEKISRLGYIIR